GGKHAGRQVPIQDVLIVPTAKTVDEGLAQAYVVYQSAVAFCKEKYQARPLVADEGGLAPPFASAEAMMEAAETSIRRAGFEPGRDIYLAVDVAASHFYIDGHYHLDSAALSSAEMIRKIESWVHN